MAGAPLSVCARDSSYVTATLSADSRRNRLADMIPKSSGSTPRSNGDRYVNDGGSSTTESWFARSIADCRCQFATGEVWNIGLGLKVPRTTMIVSHDGSNKLLPVNR